MSTTIVEQCHIAPSPGAPAEQILKLLHFDIQFLPFPPRTSLFFYNLKSSQSHFLNTIVPNFKNSLSLTLKHFPSFAGKIVVPSKSDNISIPISKYVSGQDYYPLTIAVSNADFINTTQNHEKFHLAHELPTAIISDSSETMFSVAAAQLTLFPNEGVCVAFSLHHAIGDGPIAAFFLQMLSSINRLNGRMDRMLDEKVLPSYERDVIRDGDRLAVESWRYVKTIMRTYTKPLSLGTNEVRATFVLSKEQMQMLKNVVPGRVSSFTLACAHLWTCLARSAAAAGEVAADDEPKYLCFGADCRGRLDPPLPNAYFGNCLAFVVAESSNKRLRGRDGLLAAVKAIKEAVQTAVGSKNEIMDSSLESFKQFTKRVGKKKMHLVAGSPAMDLYSVDFGWGRPIHIGDGHDRGGVSLLFKSRESEGGLEFGVSMEKVKMDAFAGFFYEGLETDKLRSKI
ncbi:hypothetical protein CASFOL_038370 [Castilleja foliolosa]|uniref:Acyltransferase n=1 Tax=Castilleja foliolosa TaxID=1961234 RepID=A0ABD3BLG1_9LAMI